MDMLASLYEIKIHTSNFLVCSSSLMCARTSGSIESKTFRPVLEALIPLREKMVRHHISTEATQQVYAIIIDSQCSI